MLQNGFLPAGFNLWSDYMFFWLCTRTLMCWNTISFAQQIWGMSGLQKIYLYIYITLSVMQFILYMVSFTLVNTMGPFIICIRMGYCSPCEAVEAWDCNCHAAWIAVGLGWLPMLQMVIARPASCLRLAGWHWCKLDSDDMSLAVLGLQLFWVVNDGVLHPKPSQHCIMGCPHIHIYSTMCAK